MKAIGAILIIVGIVMVIFREVKFTKEEKVADLGPIELNKKESKKVTWPTYAGVAIAIGGIVVLLAGNKAKR